MASEPNPFARLQRLAVATAVAVFAAVAALAWAGGVADAAKVTVLGAAAPANPSCPVGTGNDCIVEAKVTAFQTQIGKVKKPFVAPVAGRVVAWSIKLGKPSKRDQDCYTKGCTIGNTSFKGFGGPAQARLSILKPVRKEIKRGRPVYELVAQTPTEELTGFFGTTTTFTLQNPLKMKKGHIAALTIPTWAPAFATGMSEANTWRASRKPSKKRGGCFVKDDNGNILGANVNAGGPQQKTGTTRRFACQYGGNRLLYSATLVARPSS